MMTLVATAFCTLSLSAMADGARSNACSADAETHCADAKTQGRRALGQCLKNNRDKFSEDCKTQLDKRGKRGGRHGGKGKGRGMACAEDVKTHCPAAQGRREVGKCLKENQDKVSAACKEHLDSRKGGRGKRRHEQDEAS